MKVLLINLNVGSAIEYVGNVIKGWIQELPVEFIEYKEQTKETMTIDFLIKEKPNVIIINETYPRIICPVLYYKKFNHNTKIILFIHSHKSLEPLGLNIHPHLLNENMKLRDLKNLCEVVYILDGKKTDIKGDSNIIEKFCPSEPEIFYNEIDWINRPNLFCIIGGIYPLKISKEFLQKIQLTDLKFDIYGPIMEKFFPADREYGNLLETAFNKNFNYKGVIQQKEVGKILNQYKYCIFPHHGTETFFMMLQQAIMCGTLPIVLNDLNSKVYDGHWIDWADNLYLGCDNIENFISNLNGLTIDKTDYINISQFISIEINKKFDYQIFKKKFQDIISCIKN